MNTVVVTGRLVSRRDPIPGRRLQRVILEFYNEDSRDVFRAAVYGRLKVEALPEGLVEGKLIEVEGRLANIHWRTPAAGNPVRDLGIDAQSVIVLDGETARERGRVRRRATEAHVAEMRRLAERMKLDNEALREQYLRGRDPEDVPRNEAPRILQRMAQDVKELEQQAQSHSQLDRVMGQEEGAEALGEDEQVEEWVKGLLDTTIAEIPEQVGALPDDVELRRLVLEQALERETRAGARSRLEAMIGALVEEG